jgi:hypothetical protein
MTVVVLFSHDTTADILRLHSSTPFHTPMVLVEVVPKQSSGRPPSTGGDSAVPELWNEEKDICEA